MFRSQAEFEDFLTSFCRNFASRLFERFLFPAFEVQANEEDPAPRVILSERTRELLSDVILVLSAENSRSFTQLLDDLGSVVLAKEHVSDVQDQRLASEQLLNSEYRTWARC